MRGIGLLKFAYLRGWWKIIDKGTTEASFPQQELGHRGPLLVAMRRQHWPEAALKFGGWALLEKINISSPFTYYKIYRMLLSALSTTIECENMTCLRAEGWGARCSWNHCSSGDCGSCCSKAFFGKKIYETFFRYFQSTKIWFKIGPNISHPELGG